MTGINSAHLHRGPTVLLNSIKLHQILHIQGPSITLWENGEKSRNNNSLTHHVTDTEKYPLSSPWSGSAPNCNMFFADRSFMEIISVVFV